MLLWLKVRITPDSIKMLLINCQQGKGRSAKKARKGVNADATEEDFKKCPHSFVINRGHVGKNVNRLILDVRRVLEPFTASHLKVCMNNLSEEYLTK